jgi:TolB-like protein/Flp pilus assembly protein TadD
MAFRYIEEMKRRNVGRVAILYLVACWLILEPVHVIFHMLDVPIWANRLVIILMALAFPAVIIFAWVYEITPDGLKPTEEIPRGQSIRKQTGRRLDRAIIAVLALALSYFVVDKFWLSKHMEGAANEPTRAAPATTTTFAPPAHSIAVLPFVNMSGDPQQDYFSDGLSDELLNSLARVTQLQVAARTSSFSFKGKEVDIADIAHKLNVGAVLEGSVRKVGARVRITAQLINAVTGFHLWSQTYDRDLRDILALQTEIANAVTIALQATLLSGTSALIELGGTQNPLALDAYLRAQKFVGTAPDKDASLIQIAAYAEAIRLDPRYAKTYTAKSFALTSYAGNVAIGAAIREYFEQARAAAQKAIALAPELGEAHTALALVLSQGFADYASAANEHEHALALSPGSAQVVRLSAGFLSYVGRTREAITNAERAVVLDPLNPIVYRSLGVVFHYAHRDREALDAYNRALTLKPQTLQVATRRGLTYLSLGEFEAARVSCATPPLDWLSNTCLAVVYHKLNRQCDADAALAKLKADTGDDSAIQYAQIYAQWGDIPQALKWLEAAYRLHDPGLAELKVEPMLDPLREEPRFQEIERKLKFPA